MPLVLRTMLKKKILCELLSRFVVNSLAGSRQSESQQMNISMPIHALLLMCSLSTFAIQTLAAQELIFEDRFERSETDDSKEQVGNKWKTNSRSRAAGNKQVDLVDGALSIVRHEVADHGVSVVQDLQFKDATIRMRFKIRGKDQLGINLADMNEKGVHAGHICQAVIRVNKLRIQDMKTGAMKLEYRKARLAKTITPVQKKLIASKQKTIPIELDSDQWHDLVLTIKGDGMSVQIDGKSVGEFQSEGIGHATKNRLRIAVLKEAWIDDVQVFRD